MKAPTENSHSPKFPVGCSTHSSHPDEGFMGAVDVVCSASGSG